MPLTLAIVGRPNVGKSTLFNRLAGKRLAIVHDEPGVTRDRRMADGRLGSLELKLIDTAGLEDGDAGILTAQMREQTLKAVEGADVCVFLTDARAGVTAGDEIVAQLLRRGGKPVVLAANKCEGRAAHPGLVEAFRLGFGEPIALSAEHGTGLSELEDALTQFADEPVEESGEEETENVEEKPLRLAIVGRPNVGKSSLFNQLVGEERVVTGPEAGTTRDAIAVEWHQGEREILLHDTAGLRKRARAAGHELEQLSIASTLDAIKFADCVIVVIDATMPFEQQDLKISDLIAREGRAIVFAVNKWDLVENPSGAISMLREKLDRLLPQVAGASLIAISARTSEGMERLMPAVFEADKAWNTRVATNAINRFLSEALARHPPPAIHGRRVRIRYMTQTKSRPPTFALFGNQLNALPEHYLRYIQNELRGAFGFRGTPIRLLLRNSKNPYVKD
ncbi:MAG TPA: ribosome biogenesis GTPase Der [Rhizomicrobium sp.]|jgi:GTP-binding protein|nr:ribosome biogenesis GTPase Der [Rhizomicrobium sp.]